MQSKAKTFKMITQHEFTSAVTSCGFPAPSSSKCRSFNRSLPRAGISSKRESAMFLANIIQESDGLQTREEYNPPYGAYSGGNFHGRGYIQLSHDYNYREASQDLFGDNRLIVDPGLVARDEDVAWDTASWFWGKRVHNCPGVAQGDFSATVRAINGGFEYAGGVPNEQANQRSRYYAKVRRAFGI